MMEKCPILITMVLFAKNRRYYLIPIIHKKGNSGKIFDKHKKLIGRIRKKKYRKDIIVTETNGVICLRLRKLGSSVRYGIEDHFGNYLGRAGVLRMPSIEVFVVNENKKILNEKSLCQIVRNVVIK